jgi:hypothetical protein
MALLSPSPQHMTNFGFVLRYWMLQGTLQKTNRQEEVFIAWRVFLSQTCKR